MNNTTLNKIITKHENQLAVFRMMRLDAEQALLRQEQELLQKHYCDYQTASYEVWQAIEAMRLEHYKNWGNDGKLITELNRRQMEELQKAIKDMQQNT